MRIDIITVLPEMIEGFFNCSIMKRAQNKGLAEIHIHNLRDSVIAVTCTAILFATQFRKALHKLETSA